jgi:hypothetical protein
MDGTATRLLVSASVTLDREGLMFRELTNFSYQRTAPQALGWYLIFLLFGVLLAGIAGGLLGTGASSFYEGFERGSEAGWLVSTFYTAALAVVLLRSRWKSALNVFLALAGVTLGLLVGSLGGLIPLAVLTTRP